MRGSTLQCWKHYASGLPQGTHRCTEQREGLRAFLGVNSATVRRYITKPESLQRGMPMVKMRHFLEAHGYVVKELEEMDRKIHNFGQLIAYGILSVSDAFSLLNYKDETAIFRILHGERTELPEFRIKIIGKTVAEYAEELKISKHEWYQAWGIDAEATAPVVVESPVTQTVRTSPKKTEDDDFVIFGGLVRALLPVAFRLASDEATPEDRKNARSNAGAQAVFQLSNALNRLCSETARNQYNGRST